MVTDAFKIADGVEQGVDALAVCVVQLTAGQLYQIGAEGIFVLVDLGLFFADLLGEFIVPSVGQAHCLNDTDTGKLCHVCGCGACALDCDGRRVEQTLIQQSEALLLGIVGDGGNRQLFEDVCEGEQDSRCGQVKDRVDDCDAPCRNRIIDKGEVKDSVQAVEDRQEEGHTDDVEIKVDHCGTACVLVCADRREQSGHTGADVLAHDDGDRTAEGDDTGRAECLQDADAGTGTLDDAGDDGTDQNTKDGVGEADKEVGEPFLMLKRSDRRGHGAHAGHQDGKADHDGTDALTLFVFAHVEDDADKGQHRAERGGLEHLDQETVALQAGKTQDPAGNGRTNVASHDNADSLMQLHDATVDKADDHDRGRTGTLDDSGHAQTQKETFDGVVGQLAQDFLQLSASLFFKSLAHDVHAEQKQG